jgi:hypothetical protein
MLSKMKAAAPAVTDAHGISAASTSAPGGPEAAVQGRPAADTPPSPIVNGVDPTGSSVSTSAVYGKGKQCVRFEDQFSIVRFGPIYLDSEPEELFHQIVDGLLKVIRRDVLVLPRVVEKYDSQHIDLRFQSVAEAHSFAMTWTVYRYDPYKDVLAVLVDDDSS